MTTGHLSFRVSDKLLAEAKARAAEMGVTVSDLARRALDRELAAAPALGTGHPLEGAARGNPDAQAALVQRTIHVGLANGLPPMLIYERAEVLARLAGQHGRAQDAIVLATILFGGADHCPDEAEAARKRAEAVSIINIFASYPDGLGEVAADHLNQLSAALPPSVLADARGRTARATDLLASVDA
jgi:hypothetical protein